MHRFEARALASFQLAAKHIPSWLTWDVNMLYPYKTVQGFPGFNVQRLGFLTHPKSLNGRLL
jgi:hypothetical protein